MKRHNIAEITLKLQRADEMAFGGQNQAQICKNLGVSVMTLHRWRKLYYAQRAGQPAPLDQPLRAEQIDNAADSKHPSSQENTYLQEIVSENRRLRKIVADLLLEKAKLEEAAHLGPDKDLNAGILPKLF